MTEVAAPPREPRVRAPAGRSWLRTAEALLMARWTPLLLGLLSALAVAYAWGTLRALPTLYDEVSYLLQARLFADGRWSAPPIPRPEFMEQFHVVVTPFVASKYFPGHAALLVPGVLLGLPGLMPVVLSGVAGALVFAVARRVAGPWTALLTWLVWSAAPDNLRWRATYFSETTTSAAVLGTWWLLHSWRRTHRTPALLGIAFLFGLSAITRPLTALAFAAPVGIVVLRHTFARRAWGPLLGGIAVGTLCLAVVPVWGLRTTGDARVSPHTLYTRQYMPWDRPGLGLDATPPARVLPPEMQGVMREFEEAHRQHTARSLPGDAVRRAWAVRGGIFHGVGILLVLFVPVGLFAVKEGWFAAASAAAVFAAYLGYAHPWGWTLYYLEVLPILAFLAAAGVVETARRLSRRMPGPAAPLLVAGAGCLVLLQLPSTLRTVRAGSEAMQAYPRGIAAILGRVPPGERALVFFRAARGHSSHHVSLAQMDDPARTRVLVVRDRGAGNALLARDLPDRRPYLLDEAAGSLAPLQP